MTGGAGFVGSHIVDGLVHQGHQAIVLDNLSTGKLENIQPHLKTKAATLIEGDIRDPSTARRSVAEADAVIHLAALLDHETCLRDPGEANRVNAEGTLTMLKAAREDHVKRFIYASSAAVYGASPTLPLNEDSPTLPLSPYGSSKLAGEKHCLDSLAKSGMHVVCLRFFNIYGPRQTAAQYSGVITRFIGRLRENQPPIIEGDGEQTRDFIQVRDVAQATISALTYPQASGVYNIASGKETSINQLAHLLIEISGMGGLRPSYAPSRQGEIRRSVADINRARRELDFNPETDLQRGLSELWMAAAG